MENEIKTYVEELFRAVPETQESYELKLELIQNLTDKYTDLVAQGRTPEDAYNVTILGIGNLDEVLRQLDRSSAPVIKPAQEDVKRQRTLIVAVAVGLYIVSIIPVLLCELIGINDNVGVILMFLIAAAATVLIVYSSAFKAPAKQGDTVAEEFRQWQKKKTISAEILRAVNYGFWPLITALYFVISFLTHMWAVTWILFLIAPVLQRIVKTAFEIYNK